MKHKLLVTSLMILSACTLMACSHTTKKDTAASSTKESSSKVEKKTSSSLSKDTSSTKKNTSSQPSELEMQIMVTLIFQVNGSSSRISMGQKLSSIRMVVAIILSPWTALRERRQKSQLILNLMQNFQPRNWLLCGKITRMLER